MTRRRLRLRGDRVPKPRVDAGLLADLANRLTERDRKVLELVHEHRVFTTHQLADVFFPSATKARHRLVDLHRLTALDRFRPWTPTGSAPWHWVIGPGGAAVLAVGRAISIAEFGYRRDAALAISHSPRLAHQIGVNQFFTRLRATTRMNRSASLAEWWSERRCAKLWGDLVRPDAYGHWSEHTRQTRDGSDGGSSAEVDFFLEHDTGSEPLNRLIDKLTGYAALTEATGITTPVLFHLPSPRREVNLHRLIGASEVPVATAIHAATETEGPAGPIWLPAGQADRRLRLVELAHLWPPVPAQRHRHDEDEAGPA